MSCAAARINSGGARRQLVFAVEALAFALGRGDERLIHSRTVEADTYDDRVGVAQERARFLRGFVTELPIRHHDRGGIGGELLQSGGQTDAMKGRCERAAAAAGHRAVRVGAQQDDPPNPVPVERQEVVPVAKQNDTLARLVQRHPGIGGIVARDRGIGLLAVKPAHAETQTQQSADLVVDDGGRDHALVEERAHFFRLVEFGVRHLQVHAAQDHAEGIVARHPVRHQQAREPEFALEDVHVEVPVRTGVDAVDQIVGSHHALRLSVAQGDLEGAQVKFAQGAFVHVGTEAVAIRVLVIGGVVLERGGDALRLHPADVCGGGFCLPGAGLRPCTRSCVRTSARGKG